MLEVAPKNLRKNFEISKVYKAERKDQPQE